MFYRRLFDFPALRTRSFVEEFDRMKRAMDRWMEDSGLSYTRSRTGVFPLINLTGDIHNYFIRAELPGVAKEDLDLQATAKSVSISGERKIVEEEHAKYHRRERESGCFSRAVSLPGEIDPNRITASLVDGILTITVPKAEAAKPKQITVS
jgi:HSP20 family protein